MLSATQGPAKLSFFKYVDFEMMDHNNRAGAYEWGLQTLNISIEVCATWSNHSEKCTKWKYIKKAAGMKENKQRNIDKTLYGLGKIYSSCIWIISSIFICVYIYIYSKYRKISYLIISLLWRTDFWINTPPSNQRAVLVHEDQNSPDAAHALRMCSWRGGQLCEELSTPAPIQGKHISC